MYREGWGRKVQNGNKNVREFGTGIYKEGERKKYGRLVDRKVQVWQPGR